MKNFSALIIIGPTASGKTGLAHALCDSWRGSGNVCEVVNLDAFQFYKGLDIGTAKPGRSEIEHYNYHCVDILKPEDRIDAQEYASKAHAACEDIANRGGLPICVGGSGLYLRAFLHGLDELPKGDEGIRAFLRKRAEQIGWPALHRWLQAIDPARAQELHPNDSVRVERALELFFLTGKPPSESYRRTNLLQEQESLFNAFVVHVNAPDVLLRSRIEARTPAMLAAGWVKEVEDLYKTYGDALSDLQSMKAIGYRDILTYLKTPGETQDVLAINIAISTWQYARRQRTWNAKEVKHSDFVNGDNVTLLLEQVRRWWDVRTS